MPPILRRTVLKALGERQKRMT
jgi:hypothetical protein